jgi:predicted TIM-barrel fold metal-dependent hydrolase
MSGIVDSHCHIASEDFWPRSFIDGAIANAISSLNAHGIPISGEKMAALVSAKMQDPLCDELVNEMERAGISKSILLAADFTYALKDCRLTIEESFLAHRAVLQRHPGKLDVFGGVDPRWGKDGVDLFERSLIEYGFRGLKVYPPCGFSPSAPELFPFYELCAKHRAPVVVHIGPTSPALSFTTCYPFMLDEAARLFPNVDFILAHGAVAFVEECAMMCRFRPNVYLDISAYQSAMATGDAENTLRATFSRGINHKILFGTDWPVFRLQADQSTFVEAITASDGVLSELPPVEAELILHGNADRLLVEPPYSSYNDVRKTPLSTS